MKTTIARLIPLAFLCLTLWTACGDGTQEGDYQPVATARGTHVLGEDTATATIGAAGGELTSEDGRLTITIPAGALAADTAIVIDPITNFAPAGLGHAYRLTPEDTTFAKPVTITMTAGGDDLVDISIGGLMIAFQNADSMWELPGDATVDENAGTVSVETDHLSDWSLVKGAVLMPMTAEVKVNKSLGLAVRYCYTSDDPTGDGLAPLGYECTDELAPLVNVSEWSVNGVVGGNATVGTVTASGLDATYHAPAQAPSPDTVAVSARIDDGTIVVSNIKVVDEVAALNGAVDFTFTYLTAPEQTFKAKATLALTVADDGIDETNYDATGTIEMKDPVEFTYMDSVCTVQEPIKTVNDEYFLKVRKEPLSVRWGFAEYWIYHCVGAASFDISVQLYFFTGTGTGCMTFDDVPIDDADAPAGAYTTECSGTGTCTAEWSFN